MLIEARGASDNFQGSAQVIQSAAEDVSSERLSGGEGVTVTRPAENDGGGPVRAAVAN